MGWVDASVQLRSARAAESGWLSEDFEDHRDSIAPVAYLRVVSEVRLARASVVEETPMAVVLKDVPGGYNWGWYTREDPRMHIQTVDDEHRNRYKVWLETNGARAFEVDGAMPTAIREQLEEAVERERDRIEARWASFMIKKGWIGLQVVWPIVTLNLYQGTAHARTIQVDLKAELPGLEEIPASEITLSAKQAALVVGKSLPEDEQEHVSLPELFWGR